MNNYANLELLLKSFEDIILAITFDDGYLVGEVYQFDNINILVQTDAQHTLQECLDELERLAHSRLEYDADAEQEALAAESNAITTAQAEGYAHWQKEQGMGVAQNSYEPLF